MPRHAKVTISATEFPQFRRLVLFLEDVDDYARLTADEDLAGLVDACRGDLAKDVDDD